MQTALKSWRKGTWPVVDKKFQETIFKVLSPERKKILKANGFSTSLKEVRNGKAKKHS